MLTLLPSVNLQFGSGGSDVIQLIVFQMLLPKNLVLCQRVCKAWNELASHDGDHSNSIAPHPCHVRANLTVLTFLRNVVAILRAKDAVQILSYIVVVLRAQLFAP